MNGFALWFRIVRPQTLAASVCPVLVGLIAGGAPRPFAAVVTLLCALSLQILSNLVNDYYDFVRGADRKGRAGFKRALAEGLVTERQMLGACLTALSAAVLMGAYLAFSSGWQILLIGVTAILFAWLYTATSHSLSYLGIADIFVFLYYGVIASSGTAFIQNGHWSGTAFRAGAVCGLISMCVLIANNLRDMDDDRAVGKKTFPVRFGKKAGEAGYLAVILLTPLCAWLAFGWSPAMLIVVPGLALYARLRRASGAGYNECLMLAGVLNLAYVGLSLIS